MVTAYGRRISRLRFMLQKWSYIPVRFARNDKGGGGCALRSKSQGGTGVCAALEITKWEGRRMNGKEVRRQSELTKGGGKWMKTKGFNARMNRQKVAGNANE
jgi:hypothetical protein